MELKSKSLNISTGGILVVVMHNSTALQLGLKHGDRVEILPLKVKAIVDTTTKKELIKRDEFGFFQELSNQGLKNKTFYEITPAPKPESLHFIKQKLKGKPFTKETVYSVIKDIVEGNLTDVEITYFVSACYMHKLSLNETVWLTEAMINTGDKLHFPGVVADKHCIGGVAGNRTTAFVVPILAAAGVKMPKTSSRAITSPAGTADTIEVLCNVSLNEKDIKRVVKKCNGCVVWGGALDLAPADDKIIQVEHPISLDPTGQLLASVLSKKKSVGATHCLIDIPYGKGSKMPKKKEALALKEKFENIAKKIDLNLKVVLTDGSEPIGNGIGPALEARDLFWTLMNDEKGSKGLAEKGIVLAGELLELTGKVKKDQGETLARDLVKSGKAYAKFIDIIKAQGPKITDVNKIKVGKFKVAVKAKISGYVKHIDNKKVSRVAHIAGAPSDIGAGMFLFKHKKDKVAKGEVLFEIYSNSKTNLDAAKKFAVKYEVFEIF